MKAQFQAVKRKMTKTVFYPESNLLQEKVTLNKN